MKTKKQIIIGNLSARRLSEDLHKIITEDIQAKYDQLKTRYDHSFHEDRKSNLAYMFKVTLDKIRSLPASDPIRYRMGMLNKWEDFGTTADSVVLAMDELHMLDDYQFLQNFDLTPIRIFLVRLENEHGIKDVTSFDLLNCNRDFQKLFAAYLRENCDQAALKYTDNLKKAVDQIFPNEMSFEGKADLMAKITSYVFAPGTLDADQFHNIIFS